LSQRPKLAELPSARAAALAEQATTAFTLVPPMLKIAPSSRIWTAAALCRIDELRQEGEDEQRDLGIEQVGERPFAEHPPKAGARQGAIDRHPAVAGPDRLPGEIEQVGRAGIFHHQECRLRVLQDRRHAERRQHAVDEAAGGDAEAGGDACGTALGRAAGDHISHVGAGGEIESKGRGQERQQLGQVEHGTPSGRFC